jgi:hypothetical protein
MRAHSVELRMTYLFICNSIDLSSSLAGSRLDAFGGEVEFSKEPPLSNRWLRSLSSLAQEVPSNTLPVHVVDSLDRNSHGFGRRTSLCHRAAQSSSKRTQPFLSFLITDNSQSGIRAERPPGGVLTMTHFTWTKSRQIGQVPFVRLLLTGQRTH